MDKFAMREAIQSFLENQEVKNVEVLLPDFSNENNVIKLLLKEFDAENYLKAKKLIQEKKFVPEFQLFEGAEKDYIGYFKFMIDLKKDNKNFFDYLKGYTLNFEDNLLKIEVEDTLKAEKLNTMSYFKNFSLKTGANFLFFSTNPFNKSSIR